MYFSQSELCTQVTLLYILYVLHAVTDRVVLPGNNVPVKIFRQLVAGRYVVRCNIQFMLTTWLVVGLRQQLSLVEREIRSVKCYPGG